MVQSLTYLLVNMFLAHPHLFTTSYVQPVHLVVADSSLLSPRPIITQILTKQKILAGNLLNPEIPPSTQQYLASGLALTLNCVLRYLPITL